MTHIQNSIKLYNPSFPYVPWIWAVLDSLLSILPPLESIIQVLKLGFCSKRDPKSSFQLDLLHDPIISTPTNTNQTPKLSQKITTIFN